MTAWWGREATAGDPPQVSSDGTPILFVGDRAAITAAVRARIAAFTPTWSRRGPDAGDALVKLFGEQVEAIATRLSRWPEKALVELLITAGISQHPPTPATALVAFTIAPTAGQSVLVPAGLHIGASSVTGGEQVTFETDGDLVATPSRIAGVWSEQTGELTAIPSDPAPTDFLPFGTNADNGSALWIGLDGEQPIGPELSLGFAVEPPPGAPMPVGTGGVIVLPVPPSPLLQWQILDGVNLRPVQVVSDDTGALTRSGAVVLALPRSWAAGYPPGADTATPPLRWLRLGIASGRYERAPQLATLVLNAIQATAAVTVRDELLEPVDAHGRVYQVQRVPIVPQSLVLAVDEGAELTSALGNASATESILASATIWREVEELGQYGPEDRVFVLDPALGLVYTGDGVHGAAVPPGVANVIARVYRTGGGAHGAVAKDAITQLIGSAPFVTAVTNPQRASGGDDIEPRAAAILRGPEEIRARGRAVTFADYELTALATPFANVRRAHALAGHPAYPGTFTTGVVGILVVPSERDDGPPLPAGEQLAKVARHLTSAVAPAGVEVVAAVPEYHSVAVSARVLLAKGVDVGPTIERALAALNTYFDPLAGGDDGRGWPFGGALVHVAIARRLLAVDGVIAIPELDLIVDGEFVDDCSNVAIPAHSLVWPGAHQIVPIDRGANT